MQKLGIECYQKKTLETWENSAIPKFCFDSEHFFFFFLNFLNNNEKKKKKKMPETTISSILMTYSWSDSHILILGNLQDCVKDV